LLSFLYNVYWSAGTTISSVVGKTWITFASFIIQTIVIVIMQ